MEMKINRRILQSERKKRAWSQEHLATVSGLGLRTIQRIEKTGVASYESVQALAAVLALRTDELAVISNGQAKTSGRRALAGAAALVLLVSSAVFQTSNSWADQLMLDISVAPNNEDMTEGQLLIAEGKEAEMRINDKIRVLVTPTIQEDGWVFLSAKIYEILDGESVLMLEPKLVTADHKQAEVRIEGESGNSFRVLITPHTSD